MDRVPIALQAGHELRLAANIRLHPIAEPNRQRRIVAGSEMHDTLSDGGVSLLVNVPHEHGPGVVVRVIPKRKLGHLALDLELHDDDVELTPQERAKVGTELGESFGDAAADELDVVLVGVRFDGVEHVGFERGGGGGPAGLELYGMYAEVDRVDAVVDAHADLGGGGAEHVGCSADIEGLLWSARVVRGMGGQREGGDIKGRGGDISGELTVREMPAQLEALSERLMERLRSLPEMEWKP